MPECAVATCKNYSQKTKGCDVIYHSFPKDKTMKKTWLIKCKRADRVNTVHARVCSVHFTVHDYERDLQNELLGLPQRKRLKCTAIPSLNLPGNKLSMSSDPMGIPATDATYSSNSTANGTGLKKNLKPKTREHKTCKRQHASKQNEDDTTAGEQLPGISASEIRERRCSSRKIQKRAKQMVNHLLPQKRQSKMETDTCDMDYSVLQKLQKENRTLQLRCKKLQTRWEFAMKKNSKVKSLQMRVRELETQLQRGTAKQVLN